MVSHSVFFAKVQWIITRDSVGAIKRFGFGMWQNVTRIANEAQYLCCAE
jgi:hypothetical protein